jgi:NAD(P)-dependent dehydrogenase (short-subunit alcohol dehydrogenase family)
MQKFQTALITGSSRGLQRQIAVKLATEGVKKIAIHYRSGRSDAETTLSLIKAQGASGVLVQGDVADTVAAENLVNEAAQKLGGCDIFVQSVCPPLGDIYQHVMSTELSLEKWQPWVGMGPAKAAMDSIGRYLMGGVRMDSHGPARHSAGYF